METTSTPATHETSHEHRHEHRDPPLPHRDPAGRPRRPGRPPGAHPVRPGRARRLLGVRHPDVVPPRAVDRWRTAFDWRAAGGADEHVPEVPAPRSTGRPIHFLHVRSAEPGARALVLTHTYPGSFLEFLDMIGPLTDPVAHGGRAGGRLPRRRSRRCPASGSAPAGRSTPGGRGPRRPHLGRADAPARLRVLRRPRQRRRRHDRLARARGARTPRASSAPTCCSCSRSRPARPGRWTGSAPKEYAALEHLQWFQSVGGYNTMNGSRPQTIAAGLSRLAGRPARLQRAVRELRQRHQPGLPRPGAGAGQPLLADQHGGHGGALPLHRAALRRGARGQHRPDRRRGLRGRLPDDPRRSPSGTTPTSNTGPSSRRAATSPPWRSRTLVVRPPHLLRGGVSLAGPVHTGPDPVCTGDQESSPIVGRPPKCPPKAPAGGYVAHMPGDKTAASQRYDSSSRSLQGKALTVLHGRIRCNARIRFSTDHGRRRWGCALNTPLLRRAMAVRP